MSLKKVSYEAFVFLYFREIRKKRSQWPGGQSAQRLNNSYNLCPFARPAHVGECGPDQLTNSYGRSKQELILSDQFLSFFFFFWGGGGPRGCAERLLNFENSIVYKLFKID